MRVVEQPDHQRLGPLRRAKAKLIIPRRRGGQTPVLKTQHRGLVSSPVRNIFLHLSCQRRQARTYTRTPGMTSADLPSFVVFQVRSGVAHGLSIVRITADVAPVFGKRP